MGCGMISTLGMKPNANVYHAEMDALVTRVLKTISKGRPRVDHDGVITANTIRAYIDALERATLLQAQKEPQVFGGAGLDEENSSENGGFGPPSPVGHGGGHKKTGAHGGKKTHKGHH